MNITLPRFKERKYTKDGDKLCKSREEWLESIREKAMEYSEKRAVLIITISIKDAKEIEAKIKADPKIAETRQIRMFTQGTEEECKMLQEDMCIGHILIGTLQIARGVDENPSLDVLANGGLAHLTVFPECNQRVAEQAAGRVARKNQPGSGRSIIYESQVRTLLGVAEDEQWTDEEWSNWRIRRDEMVAAQLEFFRLNRIPPIMFNDALYQRMCRRIPEIRAMCDKAGNKCLYAFTQILEAWSLWNNKIEYEINKKIAEAQKEGKSVKWAVQEWEEHFFKLFDAFIADEIDKLRKFIDNSENVELFRNPAYLINAGHHQLETKDFDTAEKMYSKADQLDPEFGGIALYYLAQTYIKQSFKLFKKENERTNKNDKLQEKARNCLTKAAELAKERIAQINNILTMSGTSGMKADGRISRQYHRKIELINSFMHQCNTSIGTIDRSNDPKYKGSAVVKVTKRQAVDEGLRKYRKHVKEQQAEEKKQKEKKPAPNTTNDASGGNSTGNNHNGSRPAPAGGPDDPSPDEPVSNASAGAAPAGDDVSIPREEIKEMKNAGLGHFYELDIALPKPPWWTIGLLFIFGVAQTFFGACLFASGIGSAWGSSLMQGGWDDLKQSITMAYEALTDKMSQAFSWGKWLGQKCVHYGKALLGYLFDQLLKICPKLDKFVKKINDFFNGKKPIDVKDGLSVGEAVPTPKMSLGEVVKQHVTMHVKKELTSVSNITRLHAATLPEGHSIRKFYEKNSTLIQHIDVFCSSVNSGKDLDLLAMASTHTKLAIGSALRKSQKPPKDGSRPTFKHDFWSTVKTETWNSCVDFAVDQSINCTVVMINRDIERRNERRMKKKSPMPVPLFLPSSVYYNNSKRNNAEQQPSSAANGNTASAFSGPPPARETPAAGAADTQRVNGNGKNKLDKKRMNNRARAFINEPKSKNTKKRANERKAENANKSTEQIKKKAEEKANKIANQKMKKMAEEKTKIANAMLFPTKVAKDAMYSSFGGLEAQLFNCINGNGDIPTAEADPQSSSDCADPNSASANGNKESADSEPPAPAEERTPGQIFSRAGSSYHARFGQLTHGQFGQPYPLLNPMMHLSPEALPFLMPYVSDLKMPYYTPSTCNVEHQSSSADPGHQSSSADPGHQSSSADPGHQSSSADPGHQSSSADPGHQSSSADPGHQSSSADPGHQSSSADPGHQSSSADPGHQSSPVNADTKLQTNDDSLSLFTNFFPPSHPLYHWQLSHITKNWSTVEINGLFGIVAEKKAIATLSRRRNLRNVQFDKQRLYGKGYYVYPDIKAENLDGTPIKIEAKANNAPLTKNQDKAVKQGLIHEVIREKVSKKEAVTEGIELQKKKLQHAKAKRQAKGAKGEAAQSQSQTKRAKRKAAKGEKQLKKTLAVSRKWLPWVERTLKTLKSVFFVLDARKVYKAVSGKEGRWENGIKVMAEIGAERFAAFYAGSALTTPFLLLATVPGVGPVVYFAGVASSHMLGGAVSTVVIQKVKEKFPEVLKWAEDNLQKQSEENFQPTQLFPFF
ncbi:hypothetical protein niasHT_032332 [Heterodera trifolii]|uniref:SecA family profile domain-containing protein n=1 Tax=Heterodera trifolii TaxID=157864 RepID=A0ABD2HVC0_9BILA